MRITTLHSLHLQLIRAANNWCHIQPVASDKYFDVGSGNGACGPAVCQWKPDGSETQLWRFDKE